MRNYEDLLFEEVHAPVLDLLPDPSACILDWWKLAYRRDHVLRTQFEDEARSATSSSRCSGHLLLE